MDPAYLRAALLWYLTLVVSIALHEWGHAAMADRVGDPTPASQGRVTLNPLAHMDWIGTVLIPLANLLFIGPSTGGHFGLIGWGKPVQINPSYFRRPILDDLMVTLAGPGMNLVLATAAAVLGGLVVRFSPDATAMAVEISLMFITINSGLIAFNLLPIPPLDGGRVVRPWVGLSHEAFVRISMLSPFLLLILVNLSWFRGWFGWLVEQVSHPFLVAFHLFSGF